MIEHIVRVIKPYGLGPYIGVVLSYGSHIKWYLYGLHGKILKKGYSRISLARGIENCEAAARRLVRKEAPVLFIKAPIFTTSIPDGETREMFKEKKDG